MTNYIWSHAIGLVSGPFGAGGGHQNARDLDADRSNSLTDVRHRYVANWLYELPFGRGKRYLGSSSGIVNAVLGDWQVGGVLTIQSGSPFTVTGGQGRPNRICDGSLPVLSFRDRHGEKPRSIGRLQCFRQGRNSNGSLS